MTEYGKLRAQCPPDRLHEMQIWREGVSEKEQNKLIDEAVAERNAMKGMTRVLRHLNEPAPPGEEFPPEPFPKCNDVATRDLIRRFGEVIGDDNPLWRDEHYARKTRWGGIVAPGTFLRQIAWGTGGYPRGSPTGTNWDFFKPIHVDDSFTVYDTLGGLEEKTQPGRPRQFLETNYRTYINQRDEIVGVATRFMMQAVRPAHNRINQATADLTHYKYTEEEIVAIEQAYDQEERRGAVPRYWENVVEGEEIKPVVKGPVNLIDMVSFGGSAYPYAAHKLQLAKRKEVPGHTIIDPESGISEDGALMHFSDHLARLIVTPLATSYGEQSVSWVGHMLTNWMGDDGFLRKLHCRIYRYSPLGDTHWCKGKVVKKYVEDDKHLVDIEFEIVNQTGFSHSRGISTIQLPAKGKIMTI